MNLLDYRKNIYSQNGEDGILEKIFEILKINKGYVCEFGAWNGIEFSNTHNIYKNNPNFIPILIESNTNRFHEMEENLKSLNKKYLLNVMVSTDPKSVNSLDSLLLNLKIEDLKDNFKFLSIDVDGPDYDIWKNFTHFRPTVIMIEVNSSYAPPQEVYPCRPSGASAAIMTRLGKEKGYELICHTGNLIFVKEEVYKSLEIPDNDLNKLFLRDWVR